MHPTTGFNMLATTSSIIASAAALGGSVRCRQPAGTAGTATAGGDNNVR
jgi:hypothetical protein